MTLDNIWWLFLSIWVGVRTKDLFCVWCVCVCVGGEGVSQIRHSVIQVPKEIFKQDDIIDFKTTVLVIYSYDLLYMYNIDNIIFIFL